MDEEAIMYQALFIEILDEVLTEEEYEYFHQIAGEDEE